jgi:hypothetical protein
MIPLYANIDARIDAIQNAPVEERFMLMNAFKKEVVHMQEAERIDAITKLKSITQSRHSDRAIKELQKYAKPKYHHNSERVSKSKERTEIEYELDDDAEDHIEDESEQHIEDETEDHIESETEDHIEDETEDHIEDETEDHIEDETEDHIESETEDHIEDETEDHIEDEHDDD